jgi:polyphosphate kinase
MVRVAGLKGQQLQDVDRLSVDGMSSRQQLAAIVAEADDELVESQRAVWRDLRAKLAETGIEVLGSKTIDGGHG